jgi:hypothetical protein
MLPGDDRTVNGMLGIVAVGTPSSGRSGKWEFYEMDADGSNQGRILRNVTEQLDIF